MDDISQVALQNKIRLPDCLDYIKAARAQGLTIPVVLMGYYNPFLAYGSERLMTDVAAAGGDGFIVVDLPPEEGRSVSQVPPYHPHLSHLTYLLLPSYPVISSSYVTPANYPMSPY